MNKLSAMKLLRTNLKSLLEYDRFAHCTKGLCECPWCNARKAIALTDIYFADSPKKLLKEMVEMARPGVLAGISNIPEWYLRATNLLGEKDAEK